MPLSNLIINGDFENQFDNWTGGANTDNEIGSFEGGTPNWTEDTYLGNGNTNNTVAEMDGHSGQTTVLEQSFTVGGALSTDITFDAALRNPGHRETASQSRFWIATEMLLACQPRLTPQPMP